MGPAAGKPSAPAFAGEADIRRAFQHYKRPGQVVELRALRVPMGRAKPATVSGYFDNENDFTAAALELERRKAEGVYFTPNELDPSLLSRRANRLEDYAETTTADHDVRRICRILIDADPVRPKGISSTEAQIHAAKMVIGKAAEKMNEWFQCGRPATTAMSGNGWHVTYSVDAENTPDIVTAIKTLLAELAKECDTPEAKIDTSNHNAARIWKLPGTHARKGDSTPDRPHRLAKLIQAEDSAFIISTEKLLEFAASRAPAKSVTRPAPRTTGSRKGIAESADTLAEYLVSRGVVVKSQKEIGGGVAIMVDCVLAPEHGNNCTDSAVIWRSNGIGYECKHSRCSNATWQQFREKIDPGYSAGRMQEVATIDWGDGAATKTDTPIDGPLEIDPATPKRTAETFVQRRQSIPVDGRRWPTIRNHAGLFHHWTGGRWVEIETTELRKQLYDFTANGKYTRETKDGAQELSFNPNKRKISEAVDALESSVFYPVNAPCPGWIEKQDGDPPADELLSFPSGSVHIPSGRIIDPTPRLFNVNAIDFDYKPHAKHPVKWIEFLNQLWPGDERAILTLQEWFGLCLSGDTRYQKMLGLFGPKRSGKGTIARIQTRLVGAGNVAGPTIGSLCGPFGLQPLIGKSLAIISDARFKLRDAESGTLTERLLCISGEDQITIDRKHLPSVTMKLPTRMMFLSNELPHFHDSSGALASRFIVLTLERSFYGHENLNLTAELIDELPAILLWSIEGWKRLRARGRFEQPQSSEEAIQELEDLASPVAAFLRERCSVGPEYEATVRTVYEAWGQWCKDHGRDYVQTEQVFGRDLRAALPSLRTRQAWVNGAKVRIYSGITVGQ